MLARPLLYASTCASCRLRASITAKQIARNRKSALPQHARSFYTTATRLQQDEITASSQLPSAIDHPIRSQRPEVAALNARKKYKDALPEGTLNEEEYKVYERLYGTPVKIDEETAVQREDAEDDLEAGTGLLREGEDGILEEVEFEDVDEEDGGVAVEGEDFADGDARLARDIQATLDLEEDAAVGSGDELDTQTEESSYARSHPLTLANRFATSPSTLGLPKSTFIDPIESQLSGIANVHLSQAAHRVFGGTGLPYSTSTPALAKTMQQKPIALEAGQNHMTEIEGDVFMAMLMPGFYASVMSVLVETRKRLGTSWAQGLLEKAEQGELRILDTGAGGAGILAARELLRAEWERMHERQADTESTKALAEADGRVGGAGLSPPLGHATVLTGSSVLRKRASMLLENTTFVPRLPDYVHSEEAAKKGKFDIVIASHTLWGLREDYLRKSQINNVWNLVSQDGGVLLLLEKGVARGFEIVAAAREILLQDRIESRDRPAPLEDIDESNPVAPPREKGMIIAPCTNHARCPMYQPSGMIKGRRDICHFSQRYTRPPFLQNILGARDKNFEDVKFSYLSVIRGRDLRDEEGGEISIQQNDTATARAFRGYEKIEMASEHDQAQLSLSLPRAVLPPMKRQGHVILDLCTSAGTLERWTVPKSFSKQAFRDARKSSWGDLWALGAKTRVPRVPKVKRRKGDLDVRLVKRAQEKVVVDHDEYGRVVVRDVVETQGGKGAGKRRKKVRQKE